MEHNLKKTLIAALLILAPVASHAAAYALDAASSTLVAAALKNETKTVEVKFPALSGSLDLASGKASVKADLKALSTGDTARDGNIETYFFEVAKKASFGEASFSWKGKAADLKDLKAGEPKSVTLTGTLMLHGDKTPLSGPASLSLLADGSYKASFSGWIVDITKVKLGATLAAMNKICPQPHRVANEVKLRGDLVFKKP